MNPTTIDWPNLTHTWNPVCGCSRGCTYCYARDLHTMRHQAYLSGKRLPKRYALPFDVMQFFSEDLTQATTRQRPRTVFVGSMTDFCYWKPKWKHDVINACTATMQHTYMFLSKGEMPYWGLKFPSNCILGVTIDCCDIDSQYKRIDNFLSHHSRGFVSIEPLLGNLVLSDLAFSHKQIERVIVGANSQTGAEPPRREWIERVIERVPKEKLHWKKNIRPFLPAGVA